MPRLHLMLGKTLGGATVAMLQGTLMLVIADRHRLPAGAAWLHLPVAIGVMALIAIVFAALGTAIGSTLQDMQGFQLTMNFLVMPLFFLSGALYPLGGLPRAMAVVTWLDPLAYGVDGLRSALIATSHFGLALDVAALAAFATVFLALGSYLFSKIEI